MAPLCIRVFSILWGGVCLPRKIVSVVYWWPNLATYWILSQEAPAMGLDTHGIMGRLKMRLILRLSPPPSQTPLRLIICSPRHVLTSERVLLCLARPTCEVQRAPVLLEPPGEGTDTADVEAEGEDQGHTEGQTGGGKGAEQGEEGREQEGRGCQVKKEEGEPDGWPEQAEEGGRGGERKGLGEGGGQGHRRGRGAGGQQQEQRGGDVEQREEEEQQPGCEGREDEGEGGWSVMF